MTARDLREDLVTARDLREDLVAARVLREDLVAAREDLVDLREGSARAQPDTVKGSAPAPYNE